MAAKKKSKKKTGSGRTAYERRSQQPSSQEDTGSYIRLGGEHLRLRHHPTDFSVLAPADASIGGERLARGMRRMTAPPGEGLESHMEDVRLQTIAHHIYLVEGTDEEIVIDDHVVLETQHHDPELVDHCVREHNLQPAGRLGAAHLLRVTASTGMNPLKVANLIEREEGPGVSCTPQILIPLERYQEPALFADQWYLSTAGTSSPDLVPGADIQAPEAWQITTGSSDIVVAVIDDGFDLGHPAFTGTQIHPDARDFQGNDSLPLGEDDFVNGFNQGDYHGTPVASIAVGSHSTSSSMRGIAPGCTFLPIRIGFGPMARPIDILDVFEYVSQRADVVNCSFGRPPASFDPFPTAFRNAITALTSSGGRQGQGLVMVFAAGNDDAPTSLTGAQNLNGVRFTQNGGIVQIPAGVPVRSGYAMTEGVVVVSSMSSLQRKSGYSSWGQHITVTAPSNNQHYITSFTPPGTPGRADFVANYRGLGQVAAANQPGQGAAFSPIQNFDDPVTIDLREDIYTRRFGGTSGAAPVVTGVVALMLSVNPELTADEVSQILRATADQDLDPVLDLVNDPNTQGISGDFVGGRSPWFGSGEVNAFHAVRQAQSLGGGVDDGGTTGSLSGTTSPGLTIPDIDPAGVVSGIDIAGSGALAGIEVDVDITHSYRGDLRVLLVSPQGFVAELHRFQGGPAQDLVRTFTHNDTSDLGLFAQAGIEVSGRWQLAVGDFAFRDVGSLNSWALRLVVG